MNSRKLILIGGGGHALSVASALGDEVAGYVDVRPVEGMNYRYLGTDEHFIASPEEGSAVITVGTDSAGDLSLRRKLIGMYDGLISDSFVSADAIVDRTAVIDAGTVVLRRAVVNCNTKIGRHCIINTGAIIEHDCRIGENVFIGPGATVCGGVTIGDDVFIGANATIRPGVTIVSRAVIGMAAAVVYDIRTTGTYAGVPARKK